MVFRRQNDGNDRELREWHSGRHFRAVARCGCGGFAGDGGVFSGVVQAPLTAAVIVMEMTDNQGMKIPLMTASFLAYWVSRSVCPRPLYGALAERFLIRVEGSAPAVSGVLMDKEG